MSLTLYYACQLTQGAISIIPWLYYLSACNRDLFTKVNIAMFYFCYSKNPSNIVKYIFFPSLYILEKKISLLANVRNKCVIRKINLYFFDARKNDQIVPSKACYFQYDHRIFFKKCVNRCAY